VSVPRVEGPDTVRGAISYAADLDLPRMLRAKALRSTEPHARVLHVDASRAAAISGVTVLTRDDFRGKQASFGPVIKDQTVVAIDRVRYVGDIVALVAAENVQAAEEAVELIDVEYEPLPAVFDPTDAISPGAPLLHERTGELIRRSQEWSVLPAPNEMHYELGTNVCTAYRVADGDVEAAFADADEIFEDTYRVPTIQHGHIEPHAAVAEWRSGRKLVVYTATQDPYEIRTELAYLFGLSQNQVRIITPAVGGGFGAKIYPRLEPHVASLARKAGRPVKWVLTREEVFLTVVRHAAVVHIKTGVQRNGRLMARKVQVLYDTGAYADIGPWVAKQAGYLATGPYQISNQEIESLCIYTNKTPAGAYRAFGTPQLCWAYESQMDDIARRLGIGPLELRRRNLLADGDRFVTGQEIVGLGVRACLDKAAEAIGWQDHSSAPITVSDPRFVRAKGIACTMKSTMTPSVSSAALRMDADGSLFVETSAVEIGQGAQTVLAQIAAEVLHVPMDKISVSSPDTDHTPFDHGTKSSRITFSVGKAVEEAGRQIRTQLLAIASNLMEISIEDLELGDSEVHPFGSPEKALPYRNIFRQRFGLEVGHLFGSHVFETHGGLDPDTGKGDATAYWFSAAAGVEIELDLETGRIRIRDLVSSIDAGRAINPRLCALQNEGSILMGLGSTLFEEMLFEDGQPVSGSFLSYAMPTTLDLPDSFRTLLVEIPNPMGPFGAKGIGEVGLIPIAPAIGNALANALGGVRLKELPLSADRVYAAIAARTRGASA
jgi:CO/xanthine dehydrogenase Mo-binding subunit